MGAGLLGRLLFFFIPSLYLCLMRTVETYLLAFVFTLLTCSPLFSQESVDAVVQSSEIHFDSQRIDLGNALYAKDSTYVYRFAYENVGHAPLIVNKAVGHCPCITVEHSTEPLAPGGRDTLTVFFKPSHASKYSQQITVFNNSSRSVITLYAKGTFLKSSDWNKIGKSDPHE